jgi:membrane protein YqaA with SNARE-associated domain
VLEDLAVYAGLFSAALLAATVFPFQSELVLFALLVAEQHPWWMLLIVASAGNVLGSVVNWFLGRSIAVLENRRWFPVKRSAIARAEGWYARWGKWSLLLAWTPFLGDPLTVVAGVLRVNLGVFVLLVAIGKVARYAVVVATYGWV